MENPQAFQVFATDVNDHRVYYDKGMTLLDYFAGQAFIAIFSAIPRRDYEPDKEQAEQLSKNCYMYAQAMLKQRELTMKGN